MAEAIIDKKLMTPAQAARSLTRPVSPASIWRWATYGVIARDGERITLPHHRIGGRTFYTKADLDAFMARLGDAATEHFAQRREPRKSKRAQQKAEAARKLDRRMKATASA